MDTKGENGSEVLPASKEIVQHGKADGSGDEISQEKETCQTEDGVAILEATGGGDVSRSDSVALGRHRVRFRTSQSVIEVIPQISIEEEIFQDPVKKKLKYFDCREHRTNAGVAVLFIVILIGLTLIFYFYTPQEYFLHRKEFIFGASSRTLHFLDRNGQTALEISMGRLIDNPGQLPCNCLDEAERGTLCLVWKDRMQLEITTHESDHGITCHDISWQSFSPNFLPQDCVVLKGSYWYGGGLYFGQTWPLGNLSYEKRPYLTGSVFDRNSFGPVIDRYWVSSKGVAVLVEEHSPLYISLNASVIPTMEADYSLCFFTEESVSLHTNPNDTLPFLNYTVCLAQSVKNVHIHMLKRFAKPPERVPKEDLFRNPVWSTGVFLRGNLSQANVQNFVGNVTANGYRHSVLVIDVGWEDFFGDLEFDQTKFPNASRLTTDVKNEGFDVVLSIHPHVNYNSQAFQVCVAESYLVKSDDTNVPRLIQWYSGPSVEEYYHGIAGVIDMFPAAKDFLHSRLQTLVDTYSVDGFRCDGAELDQSHLPTCASTSFKSNPNEYMQRFGELCADFGDLSQIRSAYKLQSSSIVVRLYGKNSVWDIPNGLRSVIPTVLTLGILGYPFILTDAIGGSAYDHHRPSKELYIRWLQLSAFLPMMQFSIPPEEYDDETVQIAKEMMDIHAGLASAIMNGARKAAETLHPIIRPLWWLSPDDPTALTIDSQFLLEDVYLVAPVLWEGARERDIYLPEGTWSDPTRNVTINGPLWLLDYAVPLNKIPYFLRMV